MPLITHLDTPKGGHLAVWHYEEDADFFRERIIFNAYDEAQLQAISHPSKQREWLASRYLVRFLVDLPEAIHMEKDEYGKPRLLNVPGFVSLSHCKDYAAAIYHPTHRVGVDVEPHAETVQRIAHKFLFAHELERIEGPDKLEHLLLYWSAKETLYKLHGKKSLAFRERILIDSFKPGESGELRGKVIDSEGLEDVTIPYKRFDWGYLTWAVV